MDWLQSIPGPVFLPYYLLYLLILLVAARFLFWTSNTSPESVSGLDMISLAYLRDGPRGVIQTVFLDFWNRGITEVNPKGWAVIHPEKEDAPLTYMEFAVVKLIGAHTSLRRALYNPRKETMVVIEPYLEPTILTLESHGLLITDDDRRRHRIYKWLFLALGLLPGVLKAYLGITHNRPSGFLVLALLVYTITSMILMRKKTGATRGARRQLSKLSKQYQPEITGLKQGLSTKTGLPLLAAVLGIGVLTGYLEPLSGILSPRKGFFGTGCSGSGCSSDGGGCDGGGCGGCGD